MTDDETLRLTYAELAARRGITLAAARRMTLRHRWTKQVGNDGMTRVDVPASAVPRDPPGAVTDAGTTDKGVSLDPATVAALADATAAATVAALADTTDADRQAVRLLGDAIATLGAQLVRERERADRAEALARTLQATLDASRTWRWWRR